VRSPFLNPCIPGAARTALVGTHVAGRLDSWSAEGCISHSTPGANPRKRYHQRFMDQESLILTA
jgi:hypothetical protein